MYETLNGGVPWYLVPTTFSLLGTWYPLNISFWYLVPSKSWYLVPGYHFGLGTWYPVRWYLVPGYHFGREVSADR